VGRYGAIGRWKCVGEPGRINCGDGRINGRAGFRVFCGRRGGGDLSFSRFVVLARVMEERSERGKERKGGR